LLCGKRYLINIEQRPLKVHTLRLAAPTVNLINNCGVFGKRNTKLPVAEKACKLWSRILLTQRHLASYTICKCKRPLSPAPSKVRNEFSRLELVHCLKSPKSNQVLSEEMSNPLKTMLNFIISSQTLKF
jgi:hypothetical protein